jgi:hypothetical protein
MYIVGIGAYSDTIDGDVPILKQRVRQAIGKDVRRVGRFIQLALIGAGQAGRDAPVDTAVYLSSGLGDMGAMTEVMNTIFEQKRAPRPLSFINTVSNAACFYVSQSLALEAASSFISSQHFPLESALQCAMIDADAGRIHSALLGVVDAVVEPLSVQCSRLCLPEGTVLAEASNWLQLRTTPGEQAILGAIDEVRYFSSQSALRDWLPQVATERVTTLGLGPQMRVERQDWESDTGFTLWETPAIGYLGCTSAVTICDFLSRGQGLMIHLNRDPLGRYAAIVVQRKSA